MITIPLAEIHGDPLIAKVIVRAICYDLDIEYNYTKVSLVVNWPNDNAQEFIALARSPEAQLMGLHYTECFYPRP